MMRVKEIWYYPIKSLRGISVSSVTLTDHGIHSDRRFMLLKVSTAPSGQVTYKNMAISSFPAMALFATSVSTPTDELADKIIIVTYTNSGDGAAPTLQVPLEPDTTMLERLPVNLHQSTANAFLMPTKYSEWFSDCFGYPVVLAHLGHNGRDVLGNLSPNHKTRNPQRRLQAEAASRAPSSWFSGFLGGLSPFSTPSGVSRSDDEDYAISFQDVAPFLIVSDQSLKDVSARLPQGTDLDATKFRPNIVIECPQVAAWDEDFWAELDIGAAGGPTLQLTANCARCTSLNVDYTTGKFGDGASGQVLKKLQGDRRIDAGTPYSPVFGRYAFLKRSADGTAAAAAVISTGDDVSLSRRNDARTLYKWPGSGITPKTDLFPI